MEGLGNKTFCLDYIQHSTFIHLFCTEISTPLDNVLHSKDFRVDDRLSLQAYSKLTKHQNTM